MAENTLASLFQRAKEGDTLSVARLITLAERDAETREQMSRYLLGKWGHVPYVGITGPPGVGKSTLVDQLITLYRQAEKSVGVVAIDPSSPVTGGAILGDRIRMGKHAGDKGVFLRSLGSRGEIGGLSASVRQACRILEYSGKDIVLVETVGVGQAEVDVVRACDTVVLVWMPQSGDSVQTLKAGILEIADIVVINKKKLPGADLLKQELQGVLEERKAWLAPVLLCEALSGEGVDKVKESIDQHYHYLCQSGEKEARQLSNLLAEMRMEVRIKEDEAMEKIIQSSPMLKAKLLDGEWTVQDGAGYILNKLGELYQKRQG